MVQFLAFLASMTNAMANDTTSCLPLASTKHGHIVYGTCA